MTSTTSFSQAPTPPQKPTIEKPETTTVFTPKRQLDLTTPRPQSKPKTKKTSNSQSIFSSVKNIFPLKPSLNTEQKASDSSLPKIIHQYRKIFKLQQQKKFKEADKEINRLHNPALIGHVLKHRYLHPSGYQASFEDLTIWLKKYDDHPTAMRIYQLAQRRMPNDYDYTLQKPHYTSYMNGSVITGVRPKQFKPISYKRTSAQQSDFLDIQSTVQNHIKDGFPTGALNALTQSSVYTSMSQSERDSIIARIAQSYLVEGKPDKAFQHASLIADRHGAEIPISGWVAGIAAWQQQKYNIAGQYFQRTASSPYATDTMIPAASYWAARAYGKMNNKDRVDQWLRKAASYTTNFYGILARKKLAINHKYDWTSPIFTHNDRKLLLSFVRGERAYYLAHLGLHNLATMELEGIDPTHNSDLEKALYAFAIDRGLSRFLYKFGHSFKPDGGNHRYDSALYPTLPMWTHLKSPAIDKALTHALIRQESRFKSDVQSDSGALGLMQLLPETAAYIMDNPQLKTIQKPQLFDPKINIKIGNTYVKSLLTLPDVKNDLFYMLIAYNAGPGTLSRWKNKIKIDENDPLLFIELIPSAETRSFIEHVMENLWIYRNKFDQESPSLEALVHDVWPPYRNLD